MTKILRLLLKSNPIAYIFMLKKVSQSKMIIVFVQFTLDKLPPHQEHKISKIQKLTIGSYHIDALVEYVMIKNRNDLYL